MAAGAGAPMGTYSLPSYTGELGLAIGSDFGVQPGLVMKFTSLKHEESFTYPATGYTESRNYDVSAYSVGGRLNAAINHSWFFFFDLECAFVSSKLNSVSTSAPVPSDLQPGLVTEVGPVLAYGGGFQYKQQYENFNWGGSVSYNSILAKETLNEIRLLLRAGFTFDLSWGLKTKDEDKREQDEEFNLPRLYPIIYTLYPGQIP